MRRGEQQRQRSNPNQAPGAERERAGRDEGLGPGVRGLSPVRGRLCVAARHRRVRDVPGRAGLRGRFRFGFEPPLGVRARLGGRGLRGGVCGVRAWSFDAARCRPAQGVDRRLHRAVGALRRRRRSGGAHVSVAEGSQGGAVPHPSHLEAGWRVSLQPVRRVADQAVPGADAAGDVVGSAGGAPVVPRHEVGAARLREHRDAVQGRHDGCAREHVAHHSCANSAPESFLSR